MHQQGGEGGGVGRGRGGGTGLPKFCHQGSLSSHKLLGFLLIHPSSGAPLFRVTLLSMGSTNPGHEIFNLHLGA